MYKKHTKQVCLENLNWSTYIIQGLVNAIKLASLKSNKFEFNTRSKRRVWHFVMASANHGGEL